MANDLLYSGGHDQGYEMGTGLRRERREGVSTGRNRALLEGGVDIWAIHPGLCARISSVSSTRRGAA